jgi:ER membrane protein complex subunit 4
MDIYQKHEINWTSLASSSSSSPSSSANPIAAISTTAEQIESSKKQQKALISARQNKAMSVATKPGQQIAMSAFMLWMSGSQLNIFSITTVSGAIIGPLASLWALNSTFSHLAGTHGEVDLTTPKAIYVALNVAWLAVGLYRMSTMRLLPLTSADWTNKVLWKEMHEVTSIPPDNMIIGDW